MSWYVRSLGDGMGADGPMAELEASFEELYGADAPPDVALFRKHLLEGLHCEVMIYFSPGAEALATRSGAHPCPNPTRRGLALLAGSADAWSLLFPEHEC